MAPGHSAISRGEVRRAIRLRLRLATSSCGNYTTKVTNLEVSWDKQNFVVAT